MRGVFAPRISIGGARRHARELLGGWDGDRNHRPRAELRSATVFTVHTPLRSPRRSRLGGTRIAQSVRVLPWFVAADSTGAMSGEGVTRAARESGESPGEPAPSGPERR